MKTRRILLLAAGCAIAGGLAWRFLAPHRATPAVEPDPLNTLRVCLGCDPSTLDPAQAESVQEAFLAMALYEGLYTFDPRTLEPRPALAEGQEESEDGLTWTFHLRDARWSNGDPLTAGDFVWSWKRAQDPATRAPYARLFQGIREAKAEGTRTLVVTLDAPMYWLPSLLCLPAFLPVHRPSVEGARVWQVPGRLVANGPFALRRRRWKESILLVRSPSYWDAGHVRLAGVEALTWDNPSRAVEQYESEAVDWAWGPLSAGASALARREDWKTCPRLTVRLLTFNTQNPPFGDPRVRRAFSLAIDREELARSLPGGGEAPAVSLVPQGVPWHKPFCIAPSSDEAVRLLGEAGYPRGAALPRVVISSPSGAVEKRLAQKVAARWKASLGVEAAVETEESPGPSRDVCLSCVSGAYPDALAILRPFAVRDHSGPVPRSEWYASLVEQAIVGTGARVREGLLRQAEMFLLQDKAVVAPLTFPCAGFLVHKRVKGVWENGLEVHPLKEVTLEARAAQE